MVEAAKSISVNGRVYGWPSAPTVVICIDGSEPGYIEAAIDAGLAPHFAKFMRQGANLTALSVIPSFTNPNNLSIVTGAPPNVHGIAGNYFLDPATGKEVMMNDARFLRADTILKAFADAGARVAVVTAKDKLRALLAKGLEFEPGRAVAFSAEKADQTTRVGQGIDDALTFVGRPLPSVYSAALSEFVFAAGVRLLAAFRPDVMYLSTTDYVQHKAAPGSAAANAFYAMIDKHLGELDRAGAVVALTADHGMNAKHLPSGEPDVLYLQDFVDSRVGPGVARVVLPITDPYVAHHGALGSFACLYLPTGADRKAMLAELAATPGVELALSREAAAAQFELPRDRIGDIVVLAGRSKVFGTAPQRHDLSGLNEPLRSHGGLSEQRVPLIINRRLIRPAPEPTRNFDVFDLALNRIAQ